MYMLCWYRRAFTSYGAKTSAGEENAIFEQNVSISLARWRWRLLHYSKQVIVCNLFSRRIGAIFGMLSHHAGLPASAGLSCLCAVISQGKAVALDRWVGKWSHLSMTHKLNTDYAKNYCNWTLIDCSSYSRKCSHMFFGTQCTAAGCTVLAQITTMTLYLPSLQSADAASSSLCCASVCRRDFLFSCFSFERHFRWLSLKQNRSKISDTGGNSLVDHAAPLWTVQQTCCGYY